MKKSTKIALIAAVVLILTGSMLFAGVMERLDWDMEKLSTIEYETRTHVIDEQFESIDVKTKMAGIALKKAEDGVCRVVCRENVKAAHRVSVENGVLKIEIDDQRTLMDHIGIVSGQPMITISLPGDVYADLHIEGTTGGVDVPEDFAFENASIHVNTGSAEFAAKVQAHVQISATAGTIRVHDTGAKSMHLKVSTGMVAVENAACEETMTVHVSTGRTTVMNVNCESFVSDGDTGSIRLENVVAENKIDIERSTGDVVLNGCDAKEIKLETDTGDVTGTLLSGKTFIAKTDTGKVRIPRDKEGGLCVIETDTGDIDISIQ